MIERLRLWKIHLDFIKEHGVYSGEAYNVSKNGNCEYCGKFVIENEEQAKNHITGCPHCHRSYY